MSTCRTSLCPQRHRKESSWSSLLVACPVDMFSKKEDASPDRAAAPGARRHTLRRRCTALSNRLLKNAHLRRCPYPSSLRRTGLYVSFLGISGALYLGVFEQPAIGVFFSILLAIARSKADIRSHANSKLEIRTSKFTRLRRTRIQNLKVESPKEIEIFASHGVRFEFWSFELRVCLGFRASDFGFSASP
jgi:hypothetical protein